MLPLPRPEIVPMAPHEPGPDPRVGWILAVALIDFLIQRPLDVTDDEQSRAVRQPQRIGHAVGNVRHFPGIPTGNRQHPDLRTTIARRDEGEGLAVRRPARLTVRPGPARERPRLACRDPGDPDARHVAVVLE